jgi:phosphoribosyl-ATP pyrophosphohydrolase
MENEIEKDESLTIEQATEEVREIAEKIGEIDRREFLKRSAFVLGAAFLAGCGIKVDEQEEVTPKAEIIPDGTNEDFSEPMLEGVEAEYAERGFTLVKDPFKMDTSKFVLGATNFPTALAEGFNFGPVDGEGHSYILQYGDENTEVTYMHYTGKKPPVVGEIVPLIYKLPETMKEKGLEVAPYAISAPANMPKVVEFKEGSEYLLAPIVVSGSNSGVIPTTYNGEIVNSTYRAFEVVPDSVSQNRDGFTSWVLLEQNGEKIIVKGVVNNSNAKMYVDYKNVPEEIVRIYT